VRAALASGAIALAVVSAAACAVDRSDDGEPSAEGEADAGPIDLNQLAKQDAGSSGGRRPGQDGGRDGAPNDPPPDTGSGMRFATKVASFKPGPCAGFGQASLPDIVLGPPKGGGASKGSLDVVSLGTGGEIVLSFEPSVIVDGPGTDLVVYENAFYVAGDPNQPYVEPGEVSVSEDGQTWTTFPCDASTPPYAGCAGIHPVYATDAASAADLATGGGDPFDLATIGVTRARYVRIVDKTAQRCTSQGPDTNGFDLDAIGAVHTE
jgi:hypothetical protein